MLRDKIEKLYLYIDRTSKYQTWHSDDLGWGPPT